ncbi:tyrosine-protein phosphatase non-receptor type 13 [Pseudoliparis swirei]|uniref:tyrosine-protein phosphatase non-receptor type 13 n=1 Tax=Pseudoliparis swirei TaxID=2059687 RepID=UPI0024BEB916|nr:tyrosine-protein phosphatase non-receptor type 13 [Pseudoliparis swirei]
MHVSLAEALEVRGGPLQEEEVWAVLSQSAESLQDLFHKDPTNMGFIISPWSLLLMPSGNISFTDEYVTEQDLRAFTAPEVLGGASLTSISDIEKMHMYSLGMTLFWGADFEIPQSQPMKLGEHLNSLLLNMCDDVTLSRLSLRTVLDICSKHIRNSSFDPPFSNIRKLVRLVLGSLSQLDGLLTDRESLPERSKEIRERLRGKGLPSGRSAAPRVLERYKARSQEQTSLNRGLSRSMGSLPIQELLKGDEGAVQQYSPSYYRPNSESPTELYPKPPSLQQQHSYPYLHPLHPQQKGRPVELDRRSLPFHSVDLGPGQARKNWASSVDLACIDPEALRFGALEDARRGSSAISTHSIGRRKSPMWASRDSHFSEFAGLKSRKPHHHSALSVGSGLTGAYDRIKEKQRKLQVLRQAVDDPVHNQQRYHSDYSSSSESPSVTSSDLDYRQAKKPSDARRFSSQLALSSEHDALSLMAHNTHRHRLYDGAADEGLIGAELLLQRQEEVQRLQAHLASRLSRANLYPTDDPLVPHRTSMLDLRDPLFTSSVPLRKPKNFHGPEFVKMASEPGVALSVPSSIMMRGKVEEVQRKVGVVLLNGQKLELSCDIKAVCKDVLDMVVAHIGLVEHHLFGLAYLRDDEFFFVEPDAKLSKVAPEGWKEDPKKKKSDVPFNLFLRIKFFIDDVNLIQHAMTKHQCYLQLRKDILEERMRCDTDNAMLLASLALQAEFGDYQPELHGKTYFRLEHYVPLSVLDKVDQTTIKEELPKLHSNHYRASDSDAELEFLKVSQRLTEYGVHFHRVLPEKRSQTGIMLGVYSKGVHIFEVLNGNRTPVLRFPWRETKKISFNKKKICLQNTSDGIKHLFQTDSNKTCQYLLQLCSDQHKFHLQMKARQNNQELQDLENSPLSSLQYSLDPRSGDTVGGTVSSGSLAPSLSTRSNPDHLNRISYSEVALHKATSGTVLVQDELHFPGFNPVGSTALSNPRIMSRSHHNLGQMPESPEHQPAESYRGPSHSRLSQPPPAQVASYFQQHQRASSDTDSLLPQQDKSFVTVSQSISAWSLSKSKKESDSSSTEETGQAYVVEALEPTAAARRHTPDSQSADPVHRVTVQLVAAMSFTLVVMVILLGPSVVIAFVLQPSEEEAAASANSPVSHHRCQGESLQSVRKGLLGALNLQAEPRLPAGGLGGRSAMEVDLQRQRSPSRGHAPAASGSSVSPDVGNSTSLKCCSTASEIFMKDLGWDNWVLHPASLTVVQCALCHPRGNAVQCPPPQADPRDADSQVPCCETTSQEMVPVLYVDEFSTVVISSVPLTRGCGCDPGGDLQPLSTVHLLLEKGHPPTDSVQAPHTPQCSRPAAAGDQDQSKNKEPRWRSRRAPSTASSHEVNNTDVSNMATPRWSKSAPLRWSYGGDHTSGPGEAAGGGLGFFCDWREGIFGSPSPRRTSRDLQGTAEVGDLLKVNEELMTACQKVTTIRKAKGPASHRVQTFDLSDVVRNMRLQRQGMIQTEEQYVFCYQVILYVLRCLQAEENISG